MSISIDYRCFFGWFLFVSFGFGFKASLNLLCIIAAAIVLLVGCCWLFVPAIYCICIAYSMLLFKPDLGRSRRFGVLAKLGFSWTAHNGPAFVASELTQNTLWMLQNNLSQKRTRPESRFLCSAQSSPGAKIWDTIRQHLESASFKANNQKAMYAYLCYTKNKLTMEFQQLWTWNLDAKPWLEVFLTWNCLTSLTLKYFVKTLHLELSLWNPEPLPEP